MCASWFQPLLGLLVCVSVWLSPFGIKHCSVKSLLPARQSAAASCGRSLVSHLCVSPFLSPVQQQRAEQGAISRTWLAVCWLVLRVC